MPDSVFIPSPACHTKNEWWEHTAAVVKKLDHPAMARPAKLLQQLFALLRHRFREAWRAARHS
jgi:hypothetical protein